MSRAHVGRSLTPEHRAAISAGKRGKSLSLAHRSAISATHKGKALSPSHRAAVCAALLKRRAATGAKISLALTGKILSPLDLAQFGPSAQPRLGPRHAGTHDCMTRGVRRLRLVGLWA